MSRLVVYVGPTLPAEDIRDIAPAAEVRPPVEGGSLWREGLHTGDVVVLVDGYYRDRPAVRHKEIMGLAAAGVVVIGAASMGALRAAELDSFGMRGVGTVYQMYKSGEVWGDDEVAVKHMLDAADYRTDSIALVNLRHGCRLAIGGGAASARAARHLIAAAKALVFYERTWERIAAALARRRLSDQDGAEVARLIEFCRHRDCDIKAQDARLAVATARDLLAGPGNGTARAGASGSSRDLPMTTFLRDWMTYWSSASTHASGGWVSDVDVLDVARLYLDDYPTLHHDVLSELLCRTARDDAGSGVSPGEHLAGLLCLGDGDPLPERLAEFLSADERCSPMTEQLTLLAVRVWPISICPDWRLQVIARLKSHPSWAEWRRTVAVADTARRGNGPRVPRQAAGMVFLKRWGVSGHAVPRELARRGFLKMEHLNSLAQRYASLETRRRSRDGAQRPSLSREPARG